MPDLKIGRLPDRTPVKISFSAWPDLAAALDQYAEAYRVTYGQAEPVAELIPFMLESFLKADRSFLKVVAADGGAAPPVQHTGGRRRDASAPAAREDLS